jgi:hypothetical protein
MSFLSSVDSIAVLVIVLLIVVYFIFSYFDCKMIQSKEKLNFTNDYSDFPVNRENIQAIKLKGYTSK